MVQYQFDWDPNKEKQNIRKHQMTFRRAASVFRDPNQLSVFDDEHSEGEDRWITMGIDRSGVLRVVVHTFEQVDKGLYEIRIISARRATLAELNQHNERL